MIPTHEEIRGALTDILGAVLTADTGESDDYELISKIDMIRKNLDLISGAPQALFLFSEAEPTHNKTDDYKKCDLCFARDKAMKLLDPEEFSQWQHTGPFSEDYYPQREGI